VSPKEGTYNVKKEYKAGKLRLASFLQRRAQGIMSNVSMYKEASIFLHQQTLPLPKMGYQEAKSIKIIRFFI
jgi:hypothetical protein